MSRLVVSDISLVEKATEEDIQDVLPIGLGGKEYAKICVRQGQTIAGYKYDDANRRWDLIWKETVYLNNAEYPLRKFPWFTSDNLKPGDEIIFLHHPDGVRFYRINWDQASLELVKVDGNFHEINGFKVWMGNIYPDADWVGIVTRNSDNDTKFFAATGDSFLPTESDPLFELNTVENISISGDIFIANIIQKKPAVVGLRTNNDVEFYQFSSNYLLELLTKVPNIPKCISCKTDELFYANRQSQIYKDVLHLNNTGLYIYQYSDHTKGYKFLQSVPEFTKAHGWLPGFSRTFKIFDLDDDGNDDILFTGANGLTGLSYDSTTYKTILYPEDVKSRRFATVIFTLPSMLPHAPNPSIFLRGSDGQITWSEITKEVVTAAPPLPTFESTVSPPIIEEVPIAPEQITRIIPVEKPVLRWEDQFQASVLKRSAFAKTGAAQIHIPLADFQATTGWQLDLTIHYNSHSTASGIIGVGWSLPLAELRDYIYVDCQSSIYLDDRQYFLVAQGQRFPLTHLNKSGDVTHYKIDDNNNGSNDITIDYYATTQKWVVSGKQEEVVYGEEAVQWGLEWPYWKGPGRNASALRPTTEAWYIKSRFNKCNAKFLRYKYWTVTTRILDKYYVSDVFLENITDDYGLNVVFQYATKTSAEIAHQNSLNHKDILIFPAALTHKEFLQKCTVYTNIYTQTFKFVYKTEQHNRFLTFVSQDPTDRDDLMEFNYKQLEDRYVVTECRVLSLSLSFNYRVLQTTGREKPQNIFRYKIDGAPKFANGPNYVALAYKSDKRIVLQILNQDMSRIIKDCNRDLICPTSSSDITDFMLQAHNNMISISIESDQKRLYFYECKKDVWSKNPVVHSFDKNDLVQYNHEIIAVASSNNNMLYLYCFNLKRSYWEKTNYSISQRIIKLVLSKKLVVSFDGSRLSIFYLNYQLKWSFKTIDQGLDSLSSGNRNVLSHFHFRPNDFTNLLNTFDQMSLQVSNNFIILGCLEINWGHTLWYRVNMYLLNSENSVVKRETHFIGTEKILELTMEHYNDGNTFTLKYFFESDKYVPRISSISGKIDRDLETIKNRNIREDERHKMLKNLNDNAKDSLKFSSLVKWNRYVGQIGPEGAYFGGETLLRFTGYEWREESMSHSVPLGKHLRLERQGESVNLINQYTNQKETTMLLGASGTFYNNYPVYFAYQESDNIIKLITLKDGKSVDKILTFYNEKLLTTSNPQNLITISTKECLIRPLQSLVPTSYHYVDRTSVYGGIDLLKFGFEHFFNSNVDDLSYSETSSIIPGADKTKFGWQEVTITNHYNDTTTTTERWFNGSGDLLPDQLGNEQNEKSPAGNARNTTLIQPELLLDKSGNWIIIDSTPYSLDDELVGFYGFESYETTELGVSYGNRTTAKNKWHIENGSIIQGRFALTGQNYLQLHKHGFLEGRFQPADQNATFVASCWIRCNSYTAPDMSVPYLRAIIQTSEGNKVIGLLGKVRRIKAHWVYIEVIIDFELVHKAYQKYIDYNKKVYSSMDKLQILLKVEPSDGEISVDHIRFSPLEFDFEANIFSPISGNVMASISGDGSISRKIYDHLHRQIASIDPNGQVEFFRTNLNSQNVTLQLKPDTGIYEHFSENSLQKNWFLYNPSHWRIAPGQLIHKSSQLDYIRARPTLFHDRSAAFRSFYALLQDSSYIQLDWGTIGKVQLLRNSSTSSKISVMNRKTADIPSSGEIIVMIEDNFIWIWINSKLVADEKASQDATIPWSLFQIKARGEILIEDVFVLNNPEVTVQYYNSFGELSQQIKLEGTQTALVKQILYDEVGRESLVTKTTRIYRSEPNQPLLVYRPSFIENGHRDHNESVWKTGRLIGEVDSLNPSDEGFPYVRNLYAPNPLNEKTEVKLPGKEFSVSGKYSTKVTSHTDISFVRNVFPTSKGYHYKVEYTPSGSKKISVFDKAKNEIARYVRVPGFDHSLSTYEYDSSNRLTQIFPPEFHDRVDTFTKFTSWDEQKNNFNGREKDLAENLSIQFTYDQNGKLISKFSPDIGTIKYIYNQLGQIRFMVTVSFDDHPKTIVYYEYNEFGDPTRTGYLKKMITLKELDKLKNDVTTLPSAQDYQDFAYSNDHFDPTLRNRIRYCTTFNEDETVIEKLEFDHNENIISRDIEAVNVPSNASSLTSFKRRFIGDKLHTLVYPSTFNEASLLLLHSYNRLGQLISLGTAEDPSRFATFSYSAMGHLESEQIQPKQQFGFLRKYHYNSPGFLEEISDPYITESIDYTKNGYGQSGFGDGMVMQTSYNATWMSSADNRWFQVRDEDFTTTDIKTCFAALKHLGYLDNNNHPVKLFLSTVETSMPLVCGGSTGQQISKLLAERQPPSYFGHRYAYGNHQELVKAKYFSSDSIADVDPLQPDSFSKNIPNLTIEQSRHIWKLLTKAGYITADQKQIDIDTIIGKKGKSILNDKRLVDDLKALDGGFTLYVEPIKKFILNHFGDRNTLTRSMFEQTFQKWQNIDHTSSKLTVNWEDAIAKKISKMLHDKGYLNPKIPIIDDDLKTLLYQYESFIPKIVQLLVRKFAYALGNMVYDAQSYDIDSNGNHRLFYVGFNRFQLIYRNLTNQVESIRVNWLTGKKEEFPMEHDYHGNVVQALHKNIKHISYHPVSQRPIHITLVDGRTVYLFYDVRGERLLKRIVNAKGELTYEKFYLRDDKGKVLVDQVNKYDGTIEPETITSTYIYGPRGLCGFVRDDVFHAVVTDHAGSIKLVLKRGRVVAAYDYLPYGELMRSYGSDPQSHLDYRYTGQEWDEETGLYNFHARLYDPCIGRFYQPDPKGQYFSPYKFSGNSPISILDPDGEFAFLILGLIFGLVGAYLGGAAANNRWNPLEWDYSDPGTWLGIVGGGLAGGFMPIGFASSAAFFAGLSGSAALGIGVTSILGVGGMYLMGSAANKSLDPTKWKWDRPGTWSGLFQGFGVGSGLVGGIHQTHLFAAKLSTTGRVVFLTAAYGNGLTIGYFSGVIANDGNFKFWEWDPAVTLVAVIDGFGGGVGLAQGVTEIGRGAGKLFWNRAGSLGSKTSTIKIISNRHLLKKILKNPNHPLYKAAGAVVMTYFMGSAASGELDITKWNLHSFSTYEGILNGAFSGKDLSRMFRNVRASKIKMKQFFVKLPKVIKGHWQKKFVKVINKLLSLKSIKYSQLESNVEQQIPSKTRFKQPWMRHKLHQKIKSKLIEWKTKASELSRRKQEIFLDEKNDFLNCGSNIRRKKRAAGDFSCYIPASEGDYNDKIEIAETIFNVNDPGLINARDSFKIIPPGDSGFSEHLSQLLSITPVKLSTTKPEFWYSAIMGSALTLQETSLHISRFDAKLETVKIQLGNKKKSVIQKIITISFRAYVDDEPVLIRKSIAAEPRDMEINQRKYNDEVYSKSKLTESELQFIQQKFGIKKIIEDTFIITKGNNLVGKSGTTLVDNYMSKATAEEFNNKRVDSESSVDENKNPTILEEINLEKILTVVKKHKLENNLQKLSSDNIQVVATGAQDFFEGMSKIYNNYKKTFNIDLDSEAQFHAFLYGALKLNYKNRFHLDAFIERVAGRGYADLLLTSTKKNDWKSIPIIVELKAKPKDLPESAINQIIDTGYLYNLGLRSLSDEAVILGVNPSVPDSVKVTTAKIPKPNFINSLNIDNIDVLKEQLPKELLNLHYSMSPQTLKSNPHGNVSFGNKKNHNDIYLDHMILGELLSTKGCTVFVKCENNIQTFFFKVEGKSGPLEKWTMLNMHMNHEMETKVSSIGRPKNIENFRQIDINVNPKSCVGKNSKGQYEYVPVKVVDSVDPSGVNVNENYKKIEGGFNIDQFFNGPKNIKDTLEKFGKKLQSLADIYRQQDVKSSNTFIKSEADFQEILHGVFLAHHKLDHPDGPTTMIRVFPESNLSNAGSADLIIQKITIHDGVVKEDGVIVMELKLASSPSSAGKTLQGAIEQVKKYVGSNLKSITDLNEVTTVAACFDPKGGKILVHAETVPVTPAERPKRPCDISDPSCSGGQPSKISKNERGKRSAIYSAIMNHYNESNDFVEGKLLQTKPSSNTSTLVENGGEPTGVHMISSGGTRAEWWPLKFAGLLRNTISSVKNILMEPFSSALDDVIVTSQDNQNYFSGSLKTGLLDLGDQFLGNTDVNGLLLWGYYFAKKFSKSKTAVRNQVKTYLPDGIGEGLLANEIVDKFFYYIRETSVRLDFPPSISHYWDNSETYYEAINVTRKVINQADISNICKELWKLVCQHLEGSCDSDIINTLVHAISEDYPLLQDEIHALVHNCQIEKEDQSEYSSPYVSYNRLLYQNQNSASSVNNTIDRLSYKYLN